MGRKSFQKMKSENANKNNVPHNKGGKKGNLGSGIIFCFFANKITGQYGGIASDSSITSPPKSPMRSQSSM